jgi:hypothetical protein
MICPDRSLYRRERGPRGRPRAFAADQGSCGSSLRNDSGRDFLRHHASALRIGRSTASGYADQAHCDYLLSLKPDLPRILPRSMHFASPNNERRAGACFVQVNCGVPLWFQVCIHHRLDSQRKALPLFDRARRPHGAVQPRHRKPNRIVAGIGTWCRVVSPSAVARLRRVRVSGSRRPLNSTIRRTGHDEARAGNETLVRQLRRKIL